MRGTANQDDIEHLAAMRRKVVVPRRALAGHRLALRALTHPEVEALRNHASGERCCSEPQDA
jgi:hypothetical protein